MGGHSSFLFFFIWDRQSLRQLVLLLARLRFFFLDLDYNFLIFLIGWILCFQWFFIAPIAPIWFNFEVFIFLVKSRVYPLPRWKPLSMAAEGRVLTAKARSEAFTAAICHSVHVPDYHREENGHYWQVKHDNCHACKHTERLDSEHGRCWSDKESHTVCHRRDCDWGTCVLHATLDTFSRRQV